MANMSWGLSRVASLGVLSMLVACDAAHIQVDLPDLGSADVDIAVVDPLLCLNDGECDDGLFCTGTARCSPTEPGADARGCVAGGSPCDATQTCSEADLRCINDCATEDDADGDGVLALDCGGTDCDDNDANRFPGNVEVCDPAGHDEDCDETTFGELDLDVDGAFDAACCNGTNCGTDCDDTSGAVRPGVTEVCDMIDNDCDDTVDEGVTGAFYPDADGDGYGDADATGTPTTACVAPAGSSLRNDDCDDTTAAINPAAFDRCDGTVDDDCSGAVDDPPGGCTCEAGTSRSCIAAGVCATGSQNCIAGVWGACSISPSAEICDGIDNDCDGEADPLCSCAPGSIVACGTSVGACVQGVQTCDADGQLGACVGGRGPDADELCNGFDDDCDGGIDEGTAGTRVFYADVDGDGRGVTSNTVTACVAPPGFAPIAGDCFDNDPSATCESNVSELLVGTFANDMVAGDVDADGDMDLVVSDSFQTFVIRNEGAMGLDTSGTPIPNFGSLALGEIDATSTGLELVIAGPTSFLVRDVGGTNVQAPLGGPFVLAAVGDVSGDGELDVLLTRSSGAHDVVRFIGGVPQSANIVGGAQPVVSVFMNPTPNAGQAVIQIRGMIAGVSPGITSDEWVDPSFVRMDDLALDFEPMDCVAFLFVDAADPELVCATVQPGPLRRVPFLDTGGSVPFGPSGSVLSRPALLQPVTAADGTPRLLVFDAGARRILSLARDGTTTVLATEARGVTGMAYGDVDGDGDFDLVYSHNDGAGGVVSVENRGGQFLPEVL